MLRQISACSDPQISFCLQVRKSAGGEEFQFEVSPGTYAVTASLPESQQQTRLVNVSAGESINLTFNL